jgi:hypothetical protein
MAISKHEENERGKKRHTNESVMCEETMACDNERWDRIDISISSRL